MAVRLRLKRYGRKNRAFFRIAAFDARTARDGKPIEELGFYDPWVADETRKVSLKRERIIYWLDVGAKPTLIVGQILRKHGIHPEAGRKQSPHSSAAAPA
ncbi:MAG: 30S ribosomal protein S16 [Planctomycetes bacterium]|nr:30S ribosomal protein S16 [Planctomycetota bacterium]